MSKSTFSTKAVRVQRICTLWTHDDNFSREEFIFNGDKFPELPTAPGTLLQIVHINPTTGKTKPVTDHVVKDSNADAHSGVLSTTITIDENGSTLPGVRDTDAEKAYIFVAKPTPPDLKSKHPNLQFSIAERTAKIFGFRNRMQVMLSEADEDRHEAHHVEIVFRDVYLARADMWRMAMSELSKRTIYRNQKLLFMGTIKATIKHIYIQGQSVQSGYFSSKTKPIFRSESARYVLFIQMSKEMWDFDAEGAGEIMFNKVVSGFLPDLFKRWLMINARHLVTIILFTRMEYDSEPNTDNIQDTNTISNAKFGTFRDYYRVVVSDMASGDWVKILYQLKKEFRAFLREVSLVPKESGHVGENARQKPSTPDKLVAGQPTSASKGNILEAINLAAAQFARDYIDRDLVRTGISVIVVTPGTGVFEVDYNMLKLTTDTLVGSGIGIDLVCLSPMPLHSVPLFKYRTPHSRSSIRRKHDSEGAVNFADLKPDSATPRQHQHLAVSSSFIESQGFEQRMLRESLELQTDDSDDWRFAMPYWLDVSFWSGTSEEILELTKPRKADKIVKKSRKKGRIFSLRCRLYELQMMGVMENELGDIAIPYLEENALFPHHLKSVSGKQEHASGTLKASLNATGSYSSRGDKEYTDDQLDEARSAHKAWMETYDSSVYTPIHDRLTSGRPAEQQGHQRRQSEQSSSEHADLSKGSYSSTSLRTFRPVLGSTSSRKAEGALSQTADESLGQAERSVLSNGQSRVSTTNRFEPVPRADVLRRQKLLPKSSVSSESPQDKGALEGQQDHGRSLSSASRSTVSSRGPSPTRRAGLPPAPQAVPPSPIRNEAASRPSNWFLRQISFGGKAAAARPTTGDATIDISHGKVKPAMLTVAKEQKGAIAERLASTRLNASEKPSQPIAIRTASRAGPTSAESLSSKEASGSVETVRGIRTGRVSLGSHPGSSLKDPGSTFLIAGARTLGDFAASKVDLSSGTTGRDAPQTLSPTSAIAPWAILVNPCNPKKNVVNTQNQFRRWHHVFPKTLRTGTVKWRSLCSPAAVPLTHEWFPTAEQLATEYNESFYKISQSDDEEVTEGPRSREALMKELIGFRLSHGFQIIVGSSVADFSGRQDKVLSSILDPGYMSTDGDTIFMSVGNNIHRLECVAGGEVEIRRYTRKPMTALESSAGIDTPYQYRPYIRTAFERHYDFRDVVLRPPPKEYNWNRIDNFLAGYRDEFQEGLRFWRARFVLIPVDIPTVNQRPLPMVTEDSAEEIRLEGIRKLTQLWQKFRYMSADERNFPPSMFSKQRDPNPLAIAYHTRDPSVVLAAGPDQALFSDIDGDFQESLFSDSEKYHRSSVDMKKLAEDLQSEKGIQVLDRRWHFKLHYNCFLGFDLTNWLLSNFKDIDSRDEAIEFGNELMNKGMFHHVHKRHQFRDGNFFFQIAPEYRAPRPETRGGWFGTRKTDKSIPSTPLTDVPRTSPFGSKNLKARPDTSDSSSSASGSIQQGEKTPTREGSPKRQVLLSRMMRYDVDPRKRSYRPEIISLHYDRLHNPDNCYHFRIEWMNVTAKFIEDAVVTWATSVEKYGLKLVEIPMAEVADIVEYHPFRSPYMVTLALQPPEPHSGGANDLAYLTPQYLKSDKFAYHKALLRKLNFVLDVESASSYPAKIDVTYSWGVPHYRYTQFIHRSGVLLAQIADDGNLLLLANRLAHNRAKDNSRIRQIDPYEHKKVTTDGSQSSRLPSTPAERANPHRSPFSSPLTRPVQDTGLLQAALGSHDRIHAMSATPGNLATVTPEQVKDEVEAFCSDAARLGAFYSEAFRLAPSPSPRMMPVMDDKIPSLGLPPAISIREASPASAWASTSPLIGRGERTFSSAVSELNIGAISGIAGRRQGSEGSMSTLGKRGSVVVDGAGSEEEESLSPKKKA